MVRKRVKVSQETTQKEINVEPIFKYLNPNNNDKLSDMKGYDLQDFCILLNNYYLELRNRLGLDNMVTFGLELEFEHARNEVIKASLNQSSLKDTWILKSDGSLTLGGEINSPKMRDTFSYWKQVKEICSIVSPNAIIGTNSGGHIHIGTQVLGSKVDSWLNFIKLWSVYENIIYRFVYGDFLVARSSMSDYAKPVAKEFWNIWESLNVSTVFLGYLIDKLSCSRSSYRYRAVNFKNVDKDCKYRAGNTIEFRCPNGSLDPVIWQNNVNLFVHLLTYSKQAAFNDDVVNQRRKMNGTRYSSLDLYGEIYLDQAMELADMIFTNNLDKIYFLRQYLKSFEIGTDDYVKTKSFVKKM